MGVFGSSYTLLESQEVSVDKCPGDAGEPSSAVEPALHPRRAEAATDEARLVPTGVRLVELVLRESADP